MANGLTDHQMYGYIMRALDPHSTFYRILERVFGDPTENEPENDEAGYRIFPQRLYAKMTADNIHHPTEFPSEVSFMSLKQPFYLYCLQQYQTLSSPIAQTGRRTSLFSIMDIVEAHGGNCPHPGRETKVLDALFHGLLSIPPEKVPSLTKTEGAKFLLENTFIMYAKMLGFYLNEVDIEALKPVFSINDDILTFGQFIDRLIEESSKDSAASKDPFVLECGNDHLHLGYQYIKSEEPTRTKYPLSMMLNIAANPFTVVSEVYPTILVWPNFMTDNQIIFNLNTVRYLDETTPSDAAAPEGVQLQEYSENDSDNSGGESAEAPQADDKQSLDEPLSKDAQTPTRLSDSEGMDASAALDIVKQLENRARIDNFNNGLSKLYYRLKDFYEVSKHLTDLYLNPGLPDDVKDNFAQELVKYGLPVDWTVSEFTEVYEWLKAVNTSNQFDPVKAYLETRDKDRKRPSLKDAAEAAMTQPDCDYKCYQCMEHVCEKACTSDQVALRQETAKEPKSDAQRQNLIKVSVLKSRDKKKHAGQVRHFVMTKEGILPEYALNDGLAKINAYLEDFKEHFGRMSSGASNEEGKKAVFEELWEKYFPVKLSLLEFYAVSKFLGAISPKATVAEVMETQPVPSEVPESQKVRDQETIPGPDSDVERRKIPYGRRATDKAKPELDKVRVLSEMLTPDLVAALKKFLQNYSQTLEHAKAMAELYLSHDIREDVRKQFIQEIMVQVFSCPMSANEYSAMKNFCEELLEANKKITGNYLDK